jgi:hypothetical protein
MYVSHLRYRSHKASVRVRMPTLTEQAASNGDASTVYSEDVRLTSRPAH